MPEEIIFRISYRRTYVHLESLLRTTIDPSNFLAWLEVIQMEQKKREREKEEIILPFQMKTGE